MPICPKKLWVGLFTCLVVALSQDLVFGELSPKQIVILVNENSHESRSVGRHYAKKRGIPESRILELDTTTKEIISRDEYEQSIMQPIREVLQAKELTSKVRVLVTTYGIPLRVKAPSPSSQEKIWLEDAKAWRKSSAEFLQELKHDIEHIATQDSQSTPVPSKSSSQLSAYDIDQQAMDSLIQQVNQAIEQANRRIREVEDSDSRRVHDGALIQAIQQVNGLAGKAQILRNASEKTATLTYAPLTKIRAQLRSAERRIALLLDVPSDKGREYAYQIVQEHFGVSGVLRFANQEIQRFSFAYADASVDSELSVLWWDRSFTHPAGKLPNPLYAWYSERSQEQALRLPVTLVSRIDAPTPGLAKQLIDHAILAEQTGLAGKAYFDARGKDSKRLLSYGHYDRSIRTLSDAVRKISSYEVVLDNTKKRFSQPGEAPDVGLYVGWYRLRHYEDAFSFNPGSIGYHIASGEAASLHNPKERGWCKNALERGITVTLGPVREPYLDAFPLPTEFFGLLLTGRYSLVEAYYLSSRYLSWRMVLVGDPLYNPWRGAGLDKKVQETGILNLLSLPKSPSERDFLDPLQIRKKLVKERQRELSNLSLEEKR